MYIFDSARGRGQKCANALQTKNIDFIAGKCTFLQTEEDLDVAWERKILIFMQENVHFWQRKWWRSKMSRIVGSARRGGVIINKE